MTGRRLTFALAALALAALWASFSEKFDALHLGFGVFSVGLTLWLSRTLFETSLLPGDLDWLRRASLVRMAVYPFWLGWEVMKANVDMAKLILGPLDRIDPVLLRFDTPLESALGRVTLGNSITLTPGTFTLEIEGQTLRVHAITEDAARSPVIGQMERLIGEALGDRTGEPDPHPIITRRLEDPRFTAEAGA
jgi:multicomponent Na+:H+ antiporter subunit E